MLHLFDAIEELNAKAGTALLFGRHWEAGELLAEAATLAETPETREVFVERACEAYLEALTEQLRQGQVES